MAAPSNQIVKTFQIAGVTFCPGATAWLSRMPQGTYVRLEREPFNVNDSNAIGVYWNKQKLGFLPRGLAAELAPIMDAGVKVIARRKRDVRFGVCELAYVPITEGSPQ